MATAADSDTFTLRQRVLDALHFQETDPIPYTLPFEPEVAEKLDAYLQDRGWRDSIEEHIAVVRLPLLGVDEKIQPVYKDPFGSLWRTDQRPYHLDQPALPDPDLENFQWPDLDLLWDDSAIRSQIEAARQKGQFVVASTGFGIFERSWTLRGYENSLMDMLLNPNFYQELLEHILEILLGLVERLASMPVEGIMLSDDWGGQHGVIMGASHWRRFIQPCVQRFYETVHNTGKWTVQHCCGNVFEIIPDLIESGLDVLESLQPEAMNVYEIKRNYGRELRLWGGLGTQGLLPFGKPDEIRAEIQHLRKELGKGGGYILAPAKPIMSDVPLENAIAVVEEFTDFRREQASG